MNRNVGYVMKGGYMTFMTDRLVMKPIGIEDRDFILNQFSDEIINEHLYDAEPLRSIKEADDLISFYLNSKNDYLSRWILVLKENNMKIGTCGFHNYDSKTKSIEMGYDLKKDYWGLGLMAGAVSRIIKHAKVNMDIKYIKACIYKENFNSTKFIEKFDFKRTDEIENLLFKGKSYLHYIYLKKI